MFHIVQQKNIIRISCLARKAIMLKRNHGLRFFFFLFIFSLNLKFPKYTAELYIRLDSEISAASCGPDCAQKALQALLALFPQGSPCPAQSQISPCGPGSCPRDAAAGQVFSIPQPCYSSSEQITLYKCLECLSDSEKLPLC